MELGLTPSTARRRSILAWTSLLAPALRFMRPVTAILVGRGGLVDMAIWSKSITAAGTRRALGIFLGEWLVKRSEEHTSELQSLMRSSYAVFCLQKKTNSTIKSTDIITLDE